ncbi:unnamed protein product [Alternaria sp. RS040]
MSYKSLVADPLPYQQDKRNDLETIPNLNHLGTSCTRTWYNFHVLNDLPLPQRQGSSDHAIPLTFPLEVGKGLGEEPKDQIHRMHSSSGERKNLTAAQGRRKAQNRVAQRAFRERKERHVRGLETRLATLESSTCFLRSENESLKMALQRVLAETKVLRASSERLLAWSQPALVSSLRPEPHPQLDEYGHNQDHKVLLPTRSKVASLQLGKNKKVSAIQAWDIVQPQFPVTQDLVDVSNVIEQLDNVAGWDDHMTVFEESTI